MNKLKVIYSGTRYYKDGWLVGTVKIDEIIELEDEDIPLKEGRLLNIRGTTSFEPYKDTKYQLIGEIVNDPKWGQQLDIYSMNEDIVLETDDDKKFFLQQILTEKQVEEFYKMYDDPISVLESEDIEALMQINGVGEVVAKRLIERFQSTKDHAVAYVFFKKFELTNNLIKKLIQYYGDAVELINKFKENPYILKQDIDGIGFLRADQIALKSGIKKNSPLRITEGIQYVFDKEAEDNGSTWLGSTYFGNEIRNLLGIGLDEIKPIFKEMIDNGLVYKSDDNKKFAWMRYYNLEKNVSDKLKKMIANKPETYLEDIANKKISEYEERNPNIKLTDEQREGVHQALKNNVCVICGNAGTGKTTMIKAVLNSLPDSCTVALTSLSGQASKRMNEATGYPASTIHRLLKYNPMGGFEHDENMPLPHDVIILDECSMVSVELFWFLIRAMRDDARLIIIGDNKQLPPIGIGNLFTDLLASKTMPKQILTKIHRQAEKSAIISVSAKIRSRQDIVEPNADGEKVLGELEDLELCSYQKKDGLPKKVVDKFQEVYAENPNIQDIQIITAMKDKGDLSQLELNKKIQELVNPGIRPHVEIGKKYQVKLGDKVINRKNNYNIKDVNFKPAAVFNGSMGIVKEVKDDCLIISFFDIEEPLRITSDLYPGIQLAYAITCHSAQGSQWKQTIVTADYSSFILLSSEWLYTAVTRASKKCYLMAETKALRYGVKETKIKGRDTFLQEFLEKEN